ncbi:hypothetical protein PR202_gb01186 [Eleusine coracana subsp. coracana]|uniref:Calmodulin-binding domain-containing protein n=1 Tax=Eleusine coracana subsp. coracana TaxID=191504 RepID=A0AAV5DWT1_ELECO|nr:hypothetical protein QOZ80_5BG0420940 [Eleusine coracana subsp. coracana]GJN14365.1 hypothetical protein PR202_gb01186 [Eleusine coracana subsp. coracana]
MVRSKDVPKKPRDSLLTPPSKLRGAGFPDEGCRPSNRGGAAMSPAPASVPNYMRGTSSSDAKGGPRRRGARLAATAAPASASPALRRRTAAVRVLPRGKVLFPEPEAAPGSAGPSLDRATCSSTLKGARFPDALDLAPGATDAVGPAAMRVCPYTYCSLNGHAHAPAVPLRSFLASRRRLIKTQQSMKLKGVSAFRKKSGDKNLGGGGTVSAAAKIAPLIDEEAVGDFFVEVYTGPRVSSDMSCSDMSVDEMDDATVRKMEFLVFDRCGAEEDSVEKGEDLVFCGGGERDGRLGEKQGACGDSSSVCSDAVISRDFIEELPWMRYHGSEYDSLDDGISEEQRLRDAEIDRAQISEVQEGNSNERTSGRLGDEREQKPAEELEANDEENISSSVLGSEIAGEQEGVACRVEACEELDERDQNNIVDALCHGEPFAGQGEEKFSDAVDESEIPDQEVAGTVGSSICEESCIAETLADQEGKDDESSMKSDDEWITPDLGSEMEISEDTISNEGCGEDFSEEVTSKAVLAEDVFEQHDSVTDENLVSDVFEQDGNPENPQSNAQKELGITTSEVGPASEGSDIVYNIVDSMKDAQKEMVATELEESGTANESNPDNISSYFDAGARMEPKITTCMPNDASVESDVSLGIDGNAEYVTDGAMGPEITRCKLEDAYEEARIDQETVEDDDSVRVRDDAQKDDSDMTEFKLEDASNDTLTIQEAEQSDSSANISSDAQSESNHTTNELAPGISEDTENESKLTTCQSEDVSVESGISKESDHDGYSVDGSQNESVFMTSESEGAQEISHLVKEDEGKGNNADSEKKLENTACESGGASERPAMSQEADGHVNIIDSSDSAQKDMTIQKLDASEDIQTAEESSQLFNVEIPDPKNDCTAEGLEPQSMATEVTGMATEITDAKEPSVDDICDAFNGMNLKGDVYFDLDESPTCPMNKLIISRRRRTPEEEEYMRGFNPRAPNFLPLELDPDAEKVDLRHQMVDERKNAEEWMIDYALRRAVTNLAPARKKKVELLVQAFETVLPHGEDDKKSMTPPRPVQACN